MRDLLPPCVAVRQGYVADFAAPIWPEEAPRVARAVAGRRAEFAAGRALAREALAEFGVLPCAVPSAVDGAPRWPEGFIGSIAHSGAQVVAAIARQQDLRALGIDLEVGIRFKPGMERLVLRPEEIATLPTDATRALASTILFCAKEAFYKMQYPLTRARLGFQDARVALVSETEFHLTLLANTTMFASNHQFTGHYFATPNSITAALWLIHDHPE